jgi:DNA-3-methyladenine glycosylase
MFGPPGTLYVYFTYGMHFCMNVVCGPSGTAMAVLLRAGEVVEGARMMRARRPVSSKITDLCAGPARLAQALAVDRTFDGCDLCDARSRIRLERDGVPPPVEPLVGRRIGLGSRAGRSREYAWRFAVPGSQSLSRRFDGEDGRQIPPER